MRIDAAKIRECQSHGSYTASKCPLCTPTRPNAAPETPKRGKQPRGNFQAACAEMAAVLGPDGVKALGEPERTAPGADGPRVTEKVLQEQIEAFLRRSGVNWPVRSRMDRATTVRVGTPDFLFVFRGIPVAWEIKLPGKHPTEDQVHAMELLRRDGWRVAVIRSYDEARQAFLEIQ